MRATSRDIVSPDQEVRLPSGDTISALKVRSDHVPEAQPAPALDMQFARA